MVGGQDAAADAIGAAACIRPFLCGCEVSEVLVWLADGAGVSAIVFRRGWAWASLDSITAWQCVQYAKDLLIDRGADPAAFGLSVRDQVEHWAVFDFAALAGTGIHSLLQRWDIPAVDLSKSASVRMNSGRSGA